MMQTKLLTLSLSILLLGSCTNPAESTLSPNPEGSQPSIDGRINTTPSLETQPMETFEPTAEPPEASVTQENPIPSSAEPVIESAKEDLSMRLGVETEEIALVSYEAVIWPDGSLGCPQPGMAYKQVPREGSLIILIYEGSTYEYHSGGSQGPFLCE
jgi:hypothetical protein